ncbi:MAG: hypothetical protein ACLQSR_05025 [Limisphaerales bacterium]
MSYYITSTDHCVFLTCEGNYSLEGITTAWKEAREVLAEREWERVLVDFTALRTSPDTDELFDLAKLVWRGFPPRGRIALLIRWDQARPAKLLEMLVRSFGMYLTVFVSEEQAEAWVLENSPRKQPEELAISKRGVLQCHIP